MTGKPVSQLSGWAEPTLETAFDACDTLMLEHHPETDAYAFLKRARDAIESADYAIEQGQ